MAAVSPQAIALGLAGWLAANQLEAVVGWEGEVDLRGAGGAGAGAGGLAGLLAAVRVVDGPASAATVPPALAGTSLSFCRLEWRVTVYGADEGEGCGEGEEEEEEEEEEEGDDEGGGQRRPPTRGLFKETPLPSASLDAAWDALVLADGAKARLARTAAAALAVAAAGVRPALVTTSRLALLHGPPGTGKTSLAAALAHRLAIASGAGGGAAAVCGGGGAAGPVPVPPPAASATPALPAFARAALVEVRAHALLSRFFGESAKRVGRAFTRLASSAADPATLVVVLIDEVDTIARARAGAGSAAASSSSEPGDAARAVTALLTSLDALRARRPNVLILATSNLPGGLDAAFRDRADLRLWLGPPPPPAAYAILASGVAECVRAGLVTGGEGGEGGEGAVGGACPALPPRVEGAQAAAAAGQPAAAALLALAGGPAVAGMSGRALRRLPFLAFAALGGGGRCGAGAGGGAATAPGLVAFIGAVAEAAAAVAADREAEE